LRKALVIKLSLGKDKGDLYQIAKAEGKKLFHGSKVKVVWDHETNEKDEYVVVVQDSEGVSESELKEK